MLSKLDDPLIVEAYVSLGVPGEFQSDLLPLVNLLREIGQTGGENVRLTVIDPADEEDRRRAEERGVRPIELTQQKDAEAKAQIAFFGVYIQYGEKSTVLNLVQNGWFIPDLEYQFLREVRKLVRNDDVSGLAFVSAPGTGSLNAWQSAADQNKDNYFAFKTLIEREQGRVEELDLAERVPASVHTLLLTGLPRLEDVEVYHLDQFLMRGGNLVFLAKGFDFTMQQPDPRMAQFGMSGGGGLGFATVPQEDLRRVNDWLGRYGVLLNGEILFEPRQAMPILDIFGQYLRQFNYSAWAVYDRRQGDLPSSHPAVKDIEQVVFPWFSSLDLREAQQPGAEFDVLVQSSPGVVRRETSSMEYAAVEAAGTEAADEVLGRAAPVAVLIHGKLKSAFAPDNLPEGVDAERFRVGQVGDSRANIVVAGSAYLVSDVLLREQANGAQIFQLNRAFLLNLLEAVEGDTALLAARSRVRTISRIAPISADEEVQSAFEAFFTWFHVLALPILLAIYGTVRLTARNRRRGLSDGDRPGGDGGSRDGIEVEATAKS